MNLLNSRTYISLSTSLLTIKHTWKLRWVFFLASISTVLSIPIIAKDGFGVGPAIGVGAFGFAISIASIVVELRKIKANNDRLLFVPSPIFDHPDLSLSPWLERNGYSLHGKEAGMTVQSDSVNKYLAAGGDVGFNISKNYWKATQEITLDWRSKLLSEARGLNRIVFDSKKIRLVEDLQMTSNGELKVVEFQPTRYLEGFWTNEIASRDLKADSRTIFHGHTLFLHDDVVSPLEHSDCANFLGVSTLLIGNGSLLPLVRQSARSAQSASLAAPSGSGSVDLEDIHPGDKTLGQIICRGAEREMREEMGLADDVQIKSQMIGFSRTMSRGGKPEFFCVSWLESRNEKIELSKVEKLFTHHADGIPVDWGQAPAEIAAHLLKVSASNRATYSYPLQWALELFAEALVSAPESAPFRQALKIHQ